jgi:hypothetical protein
VLADFSAEVSFGVRNVPTALAAFGHQTLPILCYVPEFYDLGSVTIGEVKFHGYEDDPLGSTLKGSAPTRMKRNYSLDEGVAASPALVNPSKLQRSLSSGMDAPSASPISLDSLLLNGRMPCSRVGVSRPPERIKNSRLV